MRNYIIKRILLSILILFSVTFIIYAVLRCLPASYVETMAMQLAQQPGAKPYQEWLDQLNASYGLDKGIIAGYFVWLGDFAQGNFGDSWKFTVPVIQKFHDVIWLSFVMGAIAFILQDCCGYQTVFPGRLCDYGRRFDRYLVTAVLLCNFAEAGLRREAAVVRCVRACGTYLRPAGFF